MSDQSPPPSDRPDVRAGLATHPGQLEPFTKALVGPVCKTALAAATRALETVHTSLGHMHTATDALKSQRPEDRIMGPHGKVMYVVPESRKAEVRDAMGLSFGRGSKSLAEAEKTITDSETALQNTMNSRTVNPRRNEVATATIAAQIRDHIKKMDTAQERAAFVMKAISDGGLEIVTAVLNASPFISGLDRTQMSYIKEDAEKRFSPQEYNERQSLRNLRERLSNAGTHYLNHLQSIIPVPNLREAEGARALKTLREGV